MRRILFITLVFSATHAANAGECQGSGYLQDMPVLIWEAKFPSAVSQGTAFFRAEVANEGFYRELAAEFQVADGGGLNKIIVKTSNFGNAGDSGFIEYDQNQVHRHIHIEDAGGGRIADFILECQK